MDEKLDYKKWWCVKNVEAVGAQDIEPAQGILLRLLILTINRHFDTPTITNVGKLLPTEIDDVKSGSRA